MRHRWSYTHHKGVVGTKLMSLKEKQTLLTAEIISPDPDCEVCKDSIYKNEENLVWKC